MRLRRATSTPARRELVALRRLPSGVTVASPQVRRDLRALEQRFAESLPSARVASYCSGDCFSTQIGAARC